MGLPRGPLASLLLLQYSWAALGKSQLCLALIMTTSLCGMARQSRKERH
ncbi:CDH3 isoform 4 [Pongo abelii]|uniref:CDH3 isoform 4 n=1 Tax=Pongo abelii TaxID=9601 RepID=A0A2J8VVE6_PONAB|nr:CDH3 isoform 4 [Pongo abelii]